MKNAPGTKDMPWTKAMPVTLYRLNGGSLKVKSCCSHLLIKPILGLSSRIHAMVRRNTGMRMPIVSKT